MINLSTLALLRAQIMKVCDAMVMFLFKADDYDLWR